MGEVYRADDLKLGQAVALKLLPERLADDPQRLEYFHNEVRLARQVSHPNVCRVYDIGEVDGQHYLSMEYIDGEDLATLIRRIGRLPPDKGVDIARQLVPAWQRPTSATCCTEILSRPTSCSTARNPARTARRLCDVCIFRKAARLPRLARSEFPPWRIRSFSGRSSCCWSQSTSRTSLDCSYGFRPGRSAHQALESFRDQLMNGRGGYVLEVDIRKFFDNLDHGHLRMFLQLRVRDGVLLRLIGKWLKAGVMENGSVSYPDSGSPQGGVVSPIASNIFLHYVLDMWFEQEVKPRLRYRAFLIRFADDFVIGFRDHATPNASWKLYRSDSASTD